MSSIHGRGRARESGEAWLAGDGRAPPLPPMFKMSRTALGVSRLEAFVAGFDQADQEFTIERATGQRQLDDATALMTEAAELLRSYERHHHARWSAAREQLRRTTAPAAVASLTEQASEAEEKAERNALMAARLEAWLAGEDRYQVKAVDLPGVTSREQAERMADWRRNGPWGSNVRPVERGPLADPDVFEGLLAASGQVDATCPLSPAKATAFRLQTPDPRFDPSRPVCVNGFLYHPATEA